MPTGLAVLPFFTRCLHVPVVDMCSDSQSDDPQSTIAIPRPPKHTGYNDPIHSSVAD